jgi:hypothetical protein
MFLVRMNSVFVHCAENCAPDIFLLRGKSRTLSTLSTWLPTWSPTFRAQWTLQNVTKYLLLHLVKLFPVAIYLMLFVSPLPKSLFCLKPFSPLAQSIWWLDFGLGDRGFDSRRRDGFFFFASASRPAFGPTQPPTQWVSGTLSWG